MLSITKELKNIPISISLLHEQEYNNLCIMYKIGKSCALKRRAYSEKSSYKTNDKDLINNIIIPRKFSFFTEVVK
jgi:hypothetical protein